MAVITYTALRNLMAGHVVNDVYFFEIPMQVIDKTVNASRITKKSLSGQAAHYLQRIEKMYQLQTYLIEEGSELHEQMGEFLESCLGGESFTIDFYGTLTTPDVDITVQMESQNYSESRQSTSNYISISFNVRAV